MHEFAANSQFDSNESKKGCRLTAAQPGAPRFASAFWTLTWDRGNQECSVAPMSSGSRDMSYFAHCVQTTFSISQFQITQFPDPLTLSPPLLPATASPET